VGGSFEELRRDGGGVGRWEGELLWNELFEASVGIEGEVWGLSLGE